MDIYQGRAMPYDKHDMHDEINVLTITSCQYRWIIYEPINKLEEYMRYNLLRRPATSIQSKGLLELMWLDDATKASSHVKVYLPVILPWM